MRKIITVLLIVTLCVGMFSACRRNDKVQETEQEVIEEQQESYKFGYSCISMKNPYFIQLESLLTAELEKDGHELLVKDAEDDAQVQITQIQELIAAEVDAVFLIPVDWEEISPALDLLNEAGIPIINLDTRVKQLKKVDAFIGSMNTTAGVLCGEDLLERIPEGGEVIIVGCPNRNSINDRITGFEKAIAKKGFEVVARIDAKGLIDTSIEEVEKALLEHPDVVAIMCGSDPMAIGALVAANVVVAEDVIIYGVDGSPEVKKELAKEHSQIVGTVAQSTQEIATEAAKIVNLIMAEEKFEKYTFIETHFITKDNVQEYGVDEWQ